MTDLLIKNMEVKGKMEQYKKEFIEFMVDSSVLKFGCHLYYYFLFPILHTIFEQFFD